MTKKDYSKLEKDDLLKVIEKLESRKKYGLIWDEEKTKEQFEKESENALPVLKEVKSKEIKTDPSKPTNILIEGDNYHALSVLNYTHQGKIDVIYIDPPYNTGNKDFKYNDRFVDKEDSYRHSKWLTFMNKRLRLAKKLLTDDGAMFISIDDNELAQLKMICDDIFGENNVELMVWRKVGEGDAGAGRMKITYRFRVEHEYVIVCYINKETARFNKTLEIPNFKNEYKNPDKDPRGSYKAGNMSKSEDLSNEGGKNYYSVKSPTGKTFTRQWHFDKETFDRLNKDKRIYWGKKGDAVPSIKIFVNELRPTTPISLLLEKGSATSANKFLEDMFSGRVFDNPKPVELIRYLLEISTGNEAIILDFFAGTGTTGHAILDLNGNPDSHRKFIICTNDDELDHNGGKKKHKICSDVCYPRIKKVIKGYNSFVGLGGNLKYYKTAFVKNSISRDDLKMRITRECTEMLCLREGIFDEVKAKPDYHIFEQNGRIMGVYYSMERDSLSQLKKELDNMEGEKILYCFTFDPLGLDKNDFADWQGVSLEPIPQKILDIYEQIYEY
jgi:adenine-specific DNA-methyltransferase